MRNAPFEEKEAEDYAKAFGLSEYLGKETGFSDGYWKLFDYKP